jgi:hypothetical protein
LTAEHGLLGKYKETRSFDVFRKKVDVSRSRDVRIAQIDDVEATRSIRALQLASIRDGSDNRWERASVRIASGDVAVALEPLVDVFGSDNRGEVSWEATCSEIEVRMLHHARRAPHDEVKSQ